MKRPIVQPGQEVLETDVLNTALFGYIGLGKVANSLFGSAITVTNMPCVPGTGLSVNVGPGELYAPQQTDATNYSTLGTNTSVLQKQGVLISAQQLNVPAPGTSGQSIVYLIEGQIVQTDGGTTLRPYYDVENPTVPWMGPDGDGVSEFTTRDDVLTLQVKAGTAATTGSQVAPTADAGWTPLYAVTIANGATSVSTSNIVVATAAPFLPFHLSALNKVLTVATNQTLTAAQSGMVFLATAAVTLTLPSAASVPNGTLYTVTAQGFASVVAPAGTDAIGGGSGGASYAIGNGASVTFTRTDTGAWTAQAAGTPTIPIGGVLVSVISTSVPANFVRCDGSNYLQATYPAAFSAMGHNFAVLGSTVVSTGTSITATGGVAVVWDGTRAHVITCNGTSAQDSFSTDPTFATGVTNAATATVASIAGAAYDGTDVILVTNDTTPKVFQISPTAGTFGAALTTTGIASGDTVNSVVSPSTGVIAISGVNGSTPFVKISSNHGVTWTTATLPTIASTTIAGNMATDGAGTLVVGSNASGSIWYSSNSGSTFTVVSTGVTSSGGSPTVARAGGKICFRPHSGQTFGISSTGAASSWSVGTLPPDLPGTPPNPQFIAVGPVFAFGCSTGSPTTPDFQNYSAGYISTLSGNVSNSSIQPVACGSITIGYQTSPAYGVCVCSLNYNSATSFPVPDFSHVQPASYHVDVLAGTNASPGQAATSAYGSTFYKSLPEYYMRIQ